MSDKEILEKAIQKAIEGGWKNLAKTAKVTSFGFDYDGELFVLYKTKTGSGQYQSRSIHSEYDLIFNHDFAKALWGEESKNPLLGGLGIGDWKIHLQQMVIAEDPIKYLGENLPILGGATQEKAE